MNDPAKLAEVGGEREVFRGDIVVVSCGAANTAKLLLMSANDKHPNGLANRSDQVGRNYMFHNSQAVLALSPTYPGVDAPGPSPRLEWRAAKHTKGDRIDGWFES